MIICKWPDPPNDYFQGAGSSNDNNDYNDNNDNNDNTDKTDNNANNDNNNDNNNNNNDNNNISKKDKRGEGVTGMKVNVFCEAVEVILRVQSGQETCLWV